MKVLVTVKQVIDPYVIVRVKKDESGVETDNMKMSMNPFDEVALEQAVRLKENNIADEVIAVTVGSPQAVDVLRTALAVGADRAIHIEATQDIEPLTVAKTLSAICDEEKPELVLMGKQAIDDDANQTGQMLSALRGWSQGTFVSRLEMGEGEVTVTREIDSGLEKLRLPLPAVVTVDLRLNEPRHAKLPDIMKAKKKPIEKTALSDLDIEIGRRLEVLKVARPPARARGVMLETVHDLVDKLKNEAKVIG